MPAAVAMVVRPPELLGEAQWSLGPGNCGALKSMYALVLSLKLSSHWDPETTEPPTTVSVQTSEEV